MVLPCHINAIINNLGSILERQTPTVNRLEANCRICLEQIQNTFSVFTLLSDALSPNHHQNANGLKDLMKTFKHLPSGIDTIAWLIVHRVDWRHNPRTRQAIVLRGQSVHFMLNLFHIYEFQIHSNT